MARRGGSGTRAARAGAWLDRHGGRGLARAWSLGLGVVVVVLVVIERGAVATWSWLARRSLLVRLAVIGVAGFGVARLPTALAPRGGPPAVADETEALARVIRSEVGVSPAQHQLHVAWATRNLAAERGQTVAAMACSPCGDQGPARPVSSRQPATDGDRALAAAVLAAPALLDPTGGATHFLNPTLQDALARSGRLAGYRGNPYAAVRRRWIEQNGWTPLYRLGPDLEMWGVRRPAR